jgi:hypothetical protein
LGESRSNAHHAVLESGHAPQGRPPQPCHWRAGLLVRTLYTPARASFFRATRMASKGFRRGSRLLSSNSENAPKYVSNVTLCDARVAPYPLQGVLPPFPALQFAGRVFFHHFQPPARLFFYRGARIASKALAKALAAPVLQGLVLSPQLRQSLMFLPEHTSAGASLFSRAARIASKGFRPASLRNRGVPSGRLLRRRRGLLPITSNARGALSRTDRSL